MEAEQRQKRSHTTRGIINEISKIEKVIEELEKKESELENLLADEKIYTNPNKSKEITLDYKKVKEDLNYKLAEWTRLSEELQKIEAEFN